MKALGLSLTAAVLLLFSGCGLFGPWYSLSLEVENGIGGRISADPPADYYADNKIVNLTAEADSGWQLSSWTGATTADGENATVLMDANRTVTAVFKPILSRSNPTDGVLNPPSSGFAPAEGDSWTFMIYLDADNNLEPYADLDFNEIEAGLNAAGNSNFNIIILYDRLEDGDTRVYKAVGDDSSDIVSDLLSPDGWASELNMGDPATLTAFMNYCKDNFAANHYALMFWNHGGGARSVLTRSAGPADASRQICQDEGSGDYLFLDEVQKAIALSFPSGLDVVSMDACIMGTVETAYELRELCDYYVASMSSVNAYGWEYDDFFGRMQGAGGADAEALSFLMVDAYRNYTSGYSDQSISAVRTSGLGALKTGTDSLSAALYSVDEKVVIEDIRDNTVKFFNDNYELEVIAQPYIDLNDFCYLLISNEDLLSPAVSSAAENVLDSLESTVVSAYGGSALGDYYGTGAGVRRGLSIFFSKGERRYNNASHYAYQYWYTDLDCSDFGPYGYLDFCTSDNDGTVESWRELMEAWYDPYRPPVGYTPGSW